MHRGKAVQHSVRQFIIVSSISYIKRASRENGGEAPGKHRVLDRLVGLRLRCIRVRRERVSRRAFRAGLSRKVSANALKYDSTAKRDPSGSMSDPVP